MVTETDNVLRSWEYSLRAARKSSHTIRQYLGATNRFAQWKGEDWMQADKRSVQRWLVDMQQRYAPATVLHEFSGLKAFFTWLESEGDIERSPFYKMQPPRVPETEKDVVPAEVMGQLLKELDDQKQYREAAIVSLFYENGMRCSEMAGIRVGDVSWEDQYVVLRGTKNGEVRYAPFGAATAARMQRWMRKRCDPEAEWMWTGQQGRHKGVPLTTSGIAQLIVRLFKEKGVGRITPHDLRHTFATHFMEDETARQEDLMTIAGWNDPAMARRYTKSRRQARALTAHRRLSPVGRLA